MSNQVEAMAKAVETQREEYRRAHGRISREIQAALVRQLQIRGFDRHPKLQDLATRVVEIKDMLTEAQNALAIEVANQLNDMGRI